MDYDPIKDRLIRAFEGSVFGQRVFFGLLHLVFLRSWYVRRALRRLLNQKPDARVLDAGTGFGQYTDWILRRYPEAHITAVDIKQDYLQRLSGYLERAGLATRAEVRFGDLTRLQEEGPFDIVLSVDVMEHIEEDVRVFRNLTAVMVPGATLIVNTPSDQGGSDVSAEGESSFIGEHVRDGYGIEEIRGKLAEAGLIMDRAEYGYGPFGSAGWRILVQLPMKMLSWSMTTVALLPFYYLLAMPIGLILNAVDLQRENRTGTGLTVTASPAGTRGRKDP